MLSGVLCTFGAEVAFNTLGQSIVHHRAVGIITVESSRAWLTRPFFSLVLVVASWTWGGRRTTRSTFVPLRTVMLLTICRTSRTEVSLMAHCSRDCQTSAVTEPAFRAILTVCDVSLSGRKSEVMQTNLALCYCLST